MQEKQIRGKQAMKQLSDKMRDQRVQVADRVRKHVAAARILPKVVSTAGLFPHTSNSDVICPHSYKVLLHICHWTFCIVVQSHANVIPLTLFQYENGL